MATEAITPRDFPVMQAAKLNALFAEKMNNDFTSFAALMAAPDANLVFNESGGDYDVRFESNLNTHMLFIDAGNNSVHIDNSLLTGAGDGDLVMANNKSLRFIDKAGTTSANYGIGSSSFDDRLFLRVPSASAIFDLRWAGTNRGWLQEENSGMGLVFAGESSADHGAPAANGCVVYTKDNGAGKTQLMARFNTGAAQQIAIEP